MQSSCCRNSSASKVSAAALAILKRAHPNASGDFNVYLVPAGTHEDVERLERLIVKEFKNDIKGHKERLQQGHKVKGMLSQMQDKAQQLASLISLSSHCC